MTGSLRGPLRRIVRSARRRYWDSRPNERPSLTQPENYCGLFGLSDLVTLAKLGCWPLSHDAIEYIALTPSRRRRQRRLLKRRVEIALAELLIEQAPSIRRLLFAKKGVKRA